jgi:hypothetical protein
VVELDCAFPKAFGHVRVVPHPKGRRFLLPKRNARVRFGRQSFDVFDEVGPRRESARPAGWNAVWVYRVARSNDVFSEDESRYHRLLLVGDYDELLRQLKIDMLEIMLLAAFAAKAVGIPTTVPLVT